jgi:hypothetical protein
MGGPQLSTRKVLVGPLVDPGMAVQLSQLDHQQGPPRPAVDYWVIFMGSMVSEKSDYLWIYGYLWDLCFWYILVVLAQQYTVLFYCDIFCWLG